MKIRLFGYEITISYYFGAMIPLTLLLDTTGTALWGMFAAAVHELGHLWMMRLLKCPKCRIQITVFGIKMVQEEYGGQGFRRDCLISMAGPLVNLALFALFTALGGIWPESGLQNAPALSQLAIGLFNLLPIFPLDGGQALYSLLCAKVTLRTADWVLRAVSFLFLLPVAYLGFLTLFQSRYNFSILLIVGYLVFLLMLKER